MPILPTSPNAEVLSFLFFVVRPKAEVQFDFLQLKSAVLSPCRTHLVYSFEAQNLGLHRRRRSSTEDSDIMIWEE